MKKTATPIPATEDKITGYIYATKDYDKFTLGENNREIKTANVKAKKESIRNFGILNPIVVNTNFEVREGNHRLIAMKELAEEGINLPLYYIVKTTGADEMIAMNNTNVSWTYSDYIQHFANRSFSEYAKIVALSNKHDLHISAIAVILIGAYITGSKAKEDFKTGKFSLEMTQWAEFEKFLLHCQELAPYTNQNRTTKVALFSIFKHKQYNPTTMLKKIFAEYSKNNSPVNLTGTIEQCKVKLLDAYNKNSKSNKIDYFINSSGQCKIIY